MRAFYRLSSYLVWQTLQRACQIVVYCICLLMAGNAVAGESYAEQIEAQIINLVQQPEVFSIQSDAHHQLDTLLRHRESLDAYFTSQNVLIIQTWQGKIERLIVDGNDGNETTQYQLLSSERVWQLLLALDSPDTVELGVQLEVAAIRIDDVLVVVDINYPNTINQLSLSEYSASGPALAAATTVLPDCSTTGQQNALVVAVNYQDDTSQIPTTQKITARYFGAQESLADYWREASYGKTMLSGDNLGWFTLDSSVTSVNACSMTNEIRQQVLDYAATQVDIRQYSRLFIVMRQLGGGCSYVGKATTQCGIFETSDQNHSARFSTHWVLGNVVDNDVTGLDLIVHEAGHNLGLEHSGRLSWGDSSTGPVLNNDGSIFYETGDIYDAMGGSSDPTHYNAQHKYQLGWLEEWDIQRVNGSGLFTLSALANPVGATRAIQLYRGADSAGNKEYFWLANRNGFGYDGFANAMGQGALHIHQQFDENDYFTYQIDVNPVTPDNADAPLQSGQQLYDTYTGISITHNHINGDDSIALQIATAPGFSDIDEDGLFESLELSVGSDPQLTDTDGDELNDKFEVCFDGDCSTYSAYPEGGDLNPVAADTDNDVMHDRWELINGFNPLDPADALGDADSDGILNVDEFLLGTDPQGGDSDGDGLPDGLELSIGTLIDDVDSDNDGMEDGWEYYNALDPLDASDATDDDDGDTIDNLQEFNLGTNPQSQDSDKDGLLDQDELNFYGTDPALADTDADRISDREELENSTDPLLMSADSDGDGMNDDWEILRGTDPAVADGGEDKDGDGYDNIIEYLRYSLPQFRYSKPPVRNWYVDVNSATGIEDGSQINPFTRINRGMAVAEAGDTVLVAGGVYNSDTEQILSLTTPVRIQGPADRSAVVQGMGLVIGVNTPWAQVANLTLEYSGSVGMLGMNSRMTRCIVKANNGLTLQSASQARIENNVFAAAGASRAMFLLNASDVHIKNNTLVGTASGIEQSNSSEVVIENNIFETAMDLTGFSPSSDIRYNILDQAGFVGGWRNYALVPGYMNSAADDYRLTPGSPGIAMGNPLSDFSQEPEPNGYRINIGAYGGTAFATPVDDADNDGLPDSWELAFGLSTTMDSLLLDSDGDGYSNYQEYFSGSSPNDVSSIPALSSVDQDGDSVDDAIDNCPELANAQQKDKNVDGIGDACSNLINIPMLSFNSLVGLFLALTAAVGFVHRRPL